MAIARPCVEQKTNLSRKSNMKNIFAAVLMTVATVALSTSSFAAGQAKATYKAAEKTADADYKIARDKCDALSGNPKDVCIAEAKAARVQTTEQAEATYKNTAKARASALKKIAGANYDVAKAKCDAKSGNDKDVCIKEAKAALATGKANAKEDKKISEARAEASEDKRDAAYKVAAEKCDAMSGANKDACVAQAKVAYGK
jgi:hypothetical protein